MLAHAACNFEKKPGKVYHLYERNGKHQWSMLSLDDYKGKVIFLISILIKRKIKIRI